MAEIDFPKLVEEFYMPLYRFALSLSRRESDAMDLTQQTFYLWALKGHQLREASKVKTWLFTTLYREFLGKKRQDDHFVETDEEELLAEPVHIDSTLVNQLDAGLVQKAMHQLNEKFRAPLALFYLEQHSYREIAEILALPIGTVMSRISRGKAELRKQLADAADSQARKVVRWKEGS